MILFARKFIISIIYADLNIITFEYLFYLRNLFTADKKFIPSEKEEI